MTERNSSQAGDPGRPRRRSAEISLDEMREALLRSGYLLEARLQSVLEGEDWWVFPNQLVPDRTTGKGRELDIEAVKNLSAGDGLADWLSVHLLVECVNNPHPVAFIAHTEQSENEILLDFHVAGAPISLVGERKGHGEHVLSAIRAGQYHHYRSREVATQYCSFSRKKGDEVVFAHHDQQHHDVFEKLTSAVAHGVSSAATSSGVHLSVFYPILVLQGTLVEVRIRGEEFTIENTHRVAYKTSAVGPRGEELYQVDVVTEAEFPALLTVIESECGRMEAGLRAIRKRVRASLPGGNQARARSSR